VINSSLASSSMPLQKAQFQGQSRLVEGTISTTYFKDPSDTRWKTDAGMKLYRKILGVYAPGANAGDPLLVYGMAVAWTAVEALKKAGANLTRASLLRTLGTFTASGNPFLLPGVVVRTAGADHVPIDQMMLERWQKGTWRSFGGLWSYRGP
jgi:hypothetical protein